jgi:hypothetical protein
MPRCVNAGLNGHAVGPVCDGPSSRAIAASVPENDGVSTSSTSTPAADTPAGSGISAAGAGLRGSDRSTILTATLTQVIGL